MSYILDALKKSQAERQLGEVPTIHAPAMDRSHPAGVTLRQPVWLLLRVLSVVSLILLALLWRAPWQVVAPPPVSPVMTALPVVVAAPPVSTPVAVAPIKVVPAPVAIAVQAQQSKEETKVAPAPVVATVRDDDAILSLRDLPEPIQRQLPTLAIGGYIYSQNPMDRLLLIDKVLRHEGEEVAPGLLLEKLLPKAAQFNFKGYRYRVTY